MKIKNLLHKLLIKPKSTDSDSQRQELILNIILVSLLAGSLCALIITTINSLISNLAHHGNFTTTLSFTLLVCLVLAISRKGYIRTGSLIVLGLLAFTGMQLLLAWGYMLPMVLLLEILIIVIAGILFTAQWGLIISGIISVLTIGLGFLHQSREINPDLSWQTRPYMIGDAIGFSVVFLIIGLLTWLSNREIAYSLKRARASELALEIERDNLESRVIERTTQLEQTQQIRLMELQKFAEFGRINANLLHEISNPLTAAKLNIELIGKNKPSPIQQVDRNLKQMEKYLEAARLQISGQSTISTFSVDQAIKKVMKMLEFQTGSNNVEVDFTGLSGLKIKGDATKFQQIIRNLLSNAVESYANVNTSLATKKIKIRVEEKTDCFIISIQDFGPGLTDDQMSHIFEPFYTTKPTDQRNLGLGLLMVKQFVTEDFKGKINVTSNKKSGTVFRIKMKIV